jgi:ATP-dependent Clp protease ATP-binding subunit ClpC
VLGARPLRRTIQRELEDTLSERILFQELKPGQNVLVDCEGDPEQIEASKLTFSGSQRQGAPVGAEAETVETVEAA